MAVFFRGQTKLYPTLSSTLLRGIKPGKNTARRKALLLDFLTKIDTEKKALRAVSPDCREALLQHYGIRTTWLDVVDNIWVALWFACHISKTTHWPNEYMHFEKRIPDPHNKGGKQYAYVLLIASAYFDIAQSNPGYYKGDRSETIDLRVAAPSQFVRPHAQHGILVRRLSNKGAPVGDCAPMHVGTIRVELNIALDWLGSASTLTTHSLFPPAYYDFGYRELLEFVMPDNRNLGSIHRVQP